MTIVNTRKRTAPFLLVTGFLLFTAVLLIALPEAGADLGPQTVVRQFCEADALGKRVTIQGWSRIAALVEWSLEPAWDRAILITSYTVGWPVPAADNMFAIEVRYSVVSDVFASGIKEAPRIEAVIFKVRATEGAAWRIVGPPPPPFIFQQQVDATGMQQSLQQGGVNFVANSVFVWQMLRSAGWNVPYVRTDELLSTNAYRAVDTPQAGDLVVYSRDGVPYHVGFLQSADTVMSSTLNAGIVPTPLDAFSGETKLLRLVRPQSSDDDEELSQEGEAQAAPPPTATPVVEIRRPTPTPRKSVSKPKPAAKAPMKRKRRKHK